MASVNPYVNYPGTAEEAFNFYKSVFGGEFAVVQRFKDTPDGDKLPEEDQNKIMHIALPLPGGAIFMATDALESMGHPLTVGNNFHISLTVDSEGEADKTFASLSAGGHITMPLQKTFWGSYFGMVTDKFAVQWMISYDGHQPA